MHIRSLALSGLLLVLGCGRSSPYPAPSPSDAANVVTRLADEYVAAYFERFPESATRLGLPGAAHGRVTDNSPDAAARWRRREDEWLSAIRTIDSRALLGTPAWTTYGLLREFLDASQAMRVCRLELWNVSSGPVSWQANYASLAGLQPIGSDTLRMQALARLHALPRYLETEVANLRRGLREGYSAPRVIVEGTLRQLDDILRTPPDSSPFVAPARRDSTPAFRLEYLRAVAGELYPAIRAYREFLGREYLPLARAEIGVAALPQGRACYRASVRRFTSIAPDPDSIFRTGERQVDALESEMRVLAERDFGTPDLQALLTRLRQDTAFTFHTRQEIIDLSEAAIERARAAMPRWFGLVPKAAVVIREHPEFRQREGAVAQYNPSADDGSRPGIFYITTYRPERVPRAGVEAVAFHEAIPGHHLQTAIAAERRGSHPLSRYFFLSGFGEGWALYSERLADEMGLYSTAVDRMGFLTSQTFRAARLVVDAGIHARGWSRAQAVAYLTEHTTMSPLQVQGEVDRYISWPGQATAYMLGNLEIRARRAEAKRRLGSRFDIRDFHDRILEHGAVTLPMLRELIQRWLDQQPNPRLPHPGRVPGPE